MSYQGMWDVYNDDSGAVRMCIVQQAGVFAGDGRPDIAALGRAIVAGSLEDLHAVRAMVCTGPNWAQLGDDGALLAAVQAVWPTVAAARYPATADV